MTTAADTMARRRFKSPYWDVPPLGYENVSPKDYKAMQASGQVAHTVVNPSSEALLNQQAHQDPMVAVRKAAASINAQLGITNNGLTSGNSHPGSGLGPNLGVGSSKTMTASLTRQARRLYVGNIPFGCNDEEMIEFFRTNMEAASFVREPGNPVLACQINSDKNFAFLEFRTVEETSFALALDGVQCKGQGLKIRRPHDYHGSDQQAAPMMGGTGGSLDSGAGSRIAASGANLAPIAPVPHVPGVVSTIVADSPNKIYVGGLPTYLTDDQIKEILSSFGPLRAFNLIRDPSTLASKGYAFCEYLDPSITEHAIVGLNGFEIGDKNLTVQRASIGSKTHPTGSGGAGGGSSLTSGMPVTPMGPVQIQVPGFANVPIASAPRVLTEVLCLMNMVEPRELEDDEEYQEILEDIRDECEKYGAINSIQIPRPGKPGGPPVPGLGKVFVQFDSATEAQRAQVNLAGRRFANRVVVTSYFDRDRFRNKEF